MDAHRILSIPLAVIVHDDLLVWSGEPSRDYSVRSSYKLLHMYPMAPMDYTLQTRANDFCKALWDLNLPSKVKIIV